MAPEDSKSVERVPSQGNGDTTEIDINNDAKVQGEAAKFVAAHQDYPPMTPEIEKRVKKKIDAWMIPLCFLTATLGAVDKVQLGTAALYDFREDNNLTGEEYSWLGSVLSLGQLVGLFTMSYLVQRVPPGRLLCCASITWSSLTILYPACHNWAGFMTLRCLLGFVEAAITPSLTMIIASFYRKNEQPTRNAIIFAYFSSIFNGFFSWVIGYIPEDAPLKRWQYLYLLTGTINICYSIFLFFVLPDNPMNAKFLTEEEKFYATQRLAENRTGIANKDNEWKWDQVWEALLDVKVWIIFFFNIAINIPNGGLLTFGSIIIKNLGFDALQSSLLTMPFGVLATSGAWVFSYIASRWENRRTIVASIALLLPLMGTALVYGIPRSNIAGQMVGLYFMYFYWPPYIVCVSLPQANTAGQTKKAVTFALVTIGYSVGNLIGPQTFRANQAPKYTGGVVAMLCCYCVCMLFCGLYLVVTVWENRRRNRLYGKPEQVQVGTVEGLGDLTDKQQEQDFRYTH
ncbi:major facilitator superfamily domain-containing protein [Thelonectria olida]|uniref:Major facilitator superfamily domain-containing protein n=1 Tax=Thelonectria olida TaxID=1576542 RepID=A0A9P8W626_9HYPO|nr:major facilitator superfamily domain-containing protein [Thelonectria olida]